MILSTELEVGSPSLAFNEMTSLVDSGGEDVFTENFDITSNKSIDKTHIK